MVIFTIREVRDKTSKQANQSPQNSDVGLAVSTCRNIRRELDAGHNGGECYLQPQISFVQVTTSEKEYKASQPKLGASPAGAI